MPEVRATWRQQILAQSDDTVVVEGNHYFPMDSRSSDLFGPSETTSYCPWKGEAHYFHVTVDGETNHDAAWYYPDPKPEAAAVRDRVAFWRGVKVTTTAD